jgi:hypothetical protein
MNWTPQFEALLANGSSPTVPFVLKLAGQRRGLEYGKEFSAILTGDLVLAVLAGEITSAEQIPAWIGHRGGYQSVERKSAESPSPLLGWGSGQ